MLKREVTRTRNGGSKVYADVDGAGIIAACREIKERGQYAKINGVAVDLFSASAIVAVHDAISEANRAKFTALPVHRMASIAFKLIK